MSHRLSTRGSLASVRSTRASTRPSNFCGPEVNGLSLEPAANVRVTQFCCHDNTFMSLNDDERVASWRVQVSGLKDPVLIELHADATNAGLSVNGLRVLPVDDTSAKKVYVEDDFEHKWPPILGHYKGLYESNFCEVQPGHVCTGIALGHSCARDSWYPAMLTSVREDGDFDVIATLPPRSNYGDGATEGAERAVAYPAMSSKQVRVKETHTPPEQQQHSLSLKLPRDDPRRPVLLFDGSPITYLFARPTPPDHSYDHGVFAGHYHHHHHQHHHNHHGDGHKSKVNHDVHKHHHDPKLPRVRLHVNKARSCVTADVGPTIFHHFLSNDVRGVSQRSERLRKTWKLCIGPFAEHTVVLEKRFVSTDIVTLWVDGDILAEASNKDLNSHTGAYWQCDFCFSGERALEFEVYEEYQGGDTLDTKGTVLKKLRTTVICSVALGEELGLGSATLMVGDKDFNELRHMSEQYQEHSLSTTPESLRLMYDVTVPYRVSEAAIKGNLMAWISGALSPLGFDALVECCRNPSMAMDLVAPAIRAAGASILSGADAKGVDPEHDQQNQEPVKHEHEKEQTNEIAKSPKDGQNEHENHETNNAVKTLVLKEDHVQQEPAKAVAKPKRKLPKVVFA